MTGYLIYLAILVSIYTLFSLGLNLHWGYTGLLNFGHAAFMIVGAYVTVLLNLQGFPNLIAALGGMIAAAIVGAIMGLATLRLRQDYLGIVTIGLAESLRIFAINEATLTGGTQGISGFDRPLQGTTFEPNLILRLGMIVVFTLLSIWVYHCLFQWLKKFPFSFLRPIPENRLKNTQNNAQNSSRNDRVQHYRLQWIVGLSLGLLGLAIYSATVYALFYYNWVASYRRSSLLLLLLLVLAGTQWGITALIQSPWGRIIQGIREDAEVVTALGKNIFLYKLQSLMLGGAIAGLAGSFYAWHLGSVFPDQFKPQLTFDAWTIVILGGAGHPLSPLLGSTLFWGYESLSRFLFPSQWSDARLEALRLIIIGVGLIALMRWRPQGILGDRI